MVWCKTQRFVRMALVAATMACLATPGRAADWQGMTIGQPGPGREKSFADAFHATGALARGGGRDVLMLRDVPPDAVMAAVAGWPAGTDAILYLSGVLEGDLLRLKGGDLPLAQLLSALAARQVDRLALLVEDCAGLNPTPLAFDQPRHETIKVMVAASSGQGGTCPDAGARLTETLTRAAATDTIQRALGDMVLRDDLGVAVPVSEQAPAAFSPIIPAPPQVQIIQPDILPVTPVRTSAAGNDSLSSIRAVAQAQETGNTPLLIFADPSDMQRTALPRAAGLPEPAIIVGLVAAQGDIFGRAVDLGDLDLNAIAFDDLAARRILQTRDPALFGSLVAAGALDPPADQVARAVQQELARMGCYTSAVDGVWGNGSRAAVQRYFNERTDAEPVTTEAEASLFRQIILHEDITCPAPQAASARAPAPSATTTTTRRTPQPTTARAAQPAPQQQAAPQSGTRRIQSGTALGVFR